MSAANYQPGTGLSKESWTEPEKWVWEKVCQGEIASFNSRYEKDLDPEKVEGWTEARVITPQFLETILLQQPYRCALPRRGVRIEGAWIKEKLDLSNGSLMTEWWMDQSRFEKEVDLTFLHTSNLISFDGSLFKEILSLSLAKIDLTLYLNSVKVLGTLDMNSISVGCSISMEDEAEFMEVYMGGAKVGDQIFLNSAKVAGVLTMNSLRVGGSIYMRGKAVFKQISMQNAKVGGQVYLNGAKVLELLDMNSLAVGGHLYLVESAQFNQIILSSATVGGMIDLSRAQVFESLNMDAVSVGGSLYIGEGAAFKELILSGAKVGGSLETVNTKVENLFDMESISVDGSITIRGGKFNGPISINYAAIKGSLFMAPGRLTTLEVGNTHIRGGLHIGLPGYKTDWSGNAFLNLWNTQVGTLQDSGEGSWPGQLNLDGFTFTRLGGLGNAAHDSQGKNMGDREAKWFIGLLAKTKNYSPQPYHHLAAVLAATGYSQKANAILYAAKTRERAEAFKSGRWGKGLGLSLLEWTIGYGIGTKYFRSLVWVLILTAWGVGVLDTMAAFRSEALWYKAGFSLDMLLPIVALNDNYKLDFKGWQLYYFYFHELMGFLLGSFVIAGLSGITKE